MLAKVLRITAIGVLAVCMIYLIVGLTPIVSLIVKPAKDYHLPPNFKLVYNSSKKAYGVAYYSYTLDSVHPYGYVSFTSNPTKSFYIWKYGKEPESFKDSSMAKGFALMFFEQENKREEENKVKYDYSPVK
jgi:hypothetical protein